MSTQSLPRLVIAGLGGDSGKTVVSVALALAMRDRALPVRGFKKGPDYVDAAWLRWATASPARNLDTCLMGPDAVRTSFVSTAVDDGLNVIEGNRGVYDGSDAHGTHSTAELAKLLLAPVVLVVDASKVTRTAAALVLGCQALDRGVQFAGVVLNRVGGARHERVLREAIETICGLPVLGIVPRVEGEGLLPARHLGLVMPQECRPTGEMADRLREAAKALDVERLVAVAREAPPLNPTACPERGRRESGRMCRIGFLADSAFTFYYPENLDALQTAGATLVPISALTAPELPPDLDALYIGGGFPETHGALLASNARFLESLNGAAAAGLPIYAECGGLMLLSSGIWWQQRRNPMAGVLPFDVEVLPKPQGHGYTQLVVDRRNPFFPEGTVLKGHEFHYSRIVPEGHEIQTACAVTRGTGCLPGRDGVVVNRTFASYTHLHALATPEWAVGLVTAARRFAEQRHTVQRSERPKF